MKKFVCLLIAVVLAIPVTSSAFDGMRKGFVLGGGLGVAPYARWGIQDTPFSTEKAGIGASLFLGYSWDEMNMLVWEGNAASFSENSTSVGQGYTGPVWYHYYGPLGHSFFTTLGLGMYYLRVQGESANPGLGLTFGGGYEFARHIQASCSFSSGRTTDPYISSIGYTHTTINLLIQATAF